MSQKTFWHINCLNKLLKFILNFALAWKKVNRFYFSFGVTRVGNHIDYSSRGRLFHTGKDRLPLEQDFWVIKSFIVLVVQVYSPLYKAYILTNFHISSMIFSLWSSNLPSRWVWCFFFIASLSVFKGEATDYEEQE